MTVAPYFQKFCQQGIIPCDMPSVSVKEMCTQYLYTSQMIAHLNT